MSFSPQVVYGAGVGLIVLVGILLLNRSKPVLVKVRVPEAAGLDWKNGAILENPKVLDSSKPDCITCYDPATGRSLGDVKPTSKDEIPAIVARARAAQKVFAKTTFEQRREILRRLQTFVLANQRTICQVACRDSGKTMVDGAFGEILTTCEKIRWTIENGERVLAPEYRSVGMIMSHKLARVEYHPLGVVAALVSYNYPFHNVMGPIISALFAGNAIVVKGSECVAWSTQYWQEIIGTILESCGHSRDLVVLVNGTAECGEALVTSGVDKVTFIGSPQVGKKVMAAASRNLTPVVLELGGKDAAVVCEDCDYDQVVELAMRGTFQNNGQNCIGLERLIVHKDIYDKFVNTVHNLVKNLTFGEPLGGVFDCGAMTSPIQAAHVQKMIDEAVSKGARLLVGGKVVTRGSGQYYPPTLLVDVTADMLISREEAFGPVMTIIKFNSDEHAIELVNSCPYGLGASVFSKNYSRAERIGRGMRTGMLNINDFGVNYLCQGLPFGGVKDSGFDRFAGVEGLRGNCLVKSVTTDRFPGVRTRIPPMLQYPLKADSFEFTEALVQLMYGDTLLDRAKALVSLTRFSLLGSSDASGSTSVASANGKGASH